MNETQAARFINQELKKELRDFADKVESYAVKRVEDYHLIAWGKLRNAIHVKLIGDSPDNYQIICYVDGERAPYAQYVHEGIKPHLPPISPLIAWVKKKGIASDKITGRVDRIRLRHTKKGIVANQKDIASYKEANRIAWAIAKNIEMHGMPEKPFFIDAVRKAIKVL